MGSYVRLSEVAREPVGVLGGNGMSVIVGDDSEIFGRVVGATVRRYVVSSKSFVVGDSGVTRSSVSSERGVWNMDTVGVASEEVVSKGNTRIVDGLEEVVSEESSRIVDVFGGVTVTVTVG